MSDNPYLQYAPAQNANPYEKYRPIQPSRPDALSAQQGSWLGAVGQGAKQGLTDLLYGGAQIGARMGEATDTGFGPELQPGTIKSVDAAIRQREGAYEANPSVQAHPYLAGAGRIAGNIASTAPLALVPGGGTAAAVGRMMPATALGRIGAGSAIGATQGALMPSTGQNIAQDRLLGAGLGAVGGAAGGALGEAVGSTLGRAIAGNSGAVVDKFLTDSYRRVIKPSRVGQTSGPQIGAQDQRILTAVDQIIASKPNLKLTDEGGNEVVGQVPRSLRQFAEALDQTKRDVFHQYDQMAGAAGQQGVRVDLAPVEQRLRQVAQSPEVIDLHPNVAADAERLADTFAARGFYTPGEAQDVIQNLNRTLAGFWRNPTHETVSRSTLLAPVVSTLRQQLDGAIEAAQGPGYQILRNRYGALRSVEKDVAAAVQREANKIPGGIGGIFADLGATEEMMRGVLTLNPAALVRAGGIKAAKSALKYLNSPNRAISRMFSRREAPPTGPARSAIGGAMLQYSAPVGGITGGALATSPPVRPDLPRVSSGG